MICRNCEGSAPNRLQIDARLLQGILRLRRSNGSISRLPVLTRYQTDAISRMLADDIEHTLGKRLKVSKHVLG